MTGEPDLISLTAAELLRLLGGVVAVLNILGVVALGFWKHLLDKSATQHRIELEHSKQQEIESMRAEIDRLRHERELQFSTVYARREQLLSGLCRELNEAERLCMRMIRESGSPSLDEAVQKLRELRHGISDIEIYFDEDFCANCIKTLHDAESAMFKWQVFQNDISSSRKEEKEMSEMTLKEFLGALRTMRRDFTARARVLIGVTKG